jgi:hypothetical protein
MVSFGLEVTGMTPAMPHPENTTAGPPILGTPPRPATATTSMGPPANPASGSLEEVRFDALSPSTSTLDSYAPLAKTKSASNLLPPSRAPAAMETAKRMSIDAAQLDCMR